MNITHLKCLIWTIAAWLLFTCPGSKAHADSATWNGAASGDWSNSGNWIGSPATVPGTGDTATFDGAGNNNTTISLGAGVTIQNIVFDSTNAASYQIGAFGTGVETLSLDSGSIITLSATLTNAQVFDAKIDLQTGGGSYTVTNGPDATLTFAGGFLAPINASGKTFLKDGPGLVILSGNNDFLENADTRTAIFSVSDGGELRITSGLTRFAQSANTGRGGQPRSYVGQIRDVNHPTSGNTLRITGAGARLITVGLNIGGGTAGFNHLVVDSPGNSGAPSLQLSGNIESDSYGDSLVIGGSSASNTMTVSNGAYVGHANGKAWTVGKYAGGDHNSISISGAGTVVSRGGAQGSYISVGGAGNWNSVVVSDGATLQPRRLGIGTGGGSSNFLHVTGSGSFLSGNDSQPIIEISRSVGASGNYMLIDDGATATFDSNQNRGYMIGALDNANDNYIRVEGVGSTFTMRQGMPLAIGGIAGQNNNNHAIIDSTATGNHLDIFNGAKSFQNTVYLLGVNSAVNLGDAGATSELEVRTSAGSPSYGSGVQLSKTSSRLNINNGRLTGGGGGAMVSGSGIISNAGPAYFSTAYTNSIDSVITGPGSFTKEGVGILALSATNTYTGMTIVSNGVLRLTNPEALAAETEVWITTGAKVDLDYVGVDTVSALYIDGVRQAAGLYGQARLPQYLSGGGSLRTLVGKVTKDILFIVR